MTRIMVMSETRPLSFVKAHLSEITDRVERQHDRVTITRNGQPAAVILSPDDLESLEETLAILSDPEMMGKVRAGTEAAAAGDMLSLEDLRNRRSRGG